MTVKERVSDTLRREAAAQKKDEYVVARRITVVSYQETEANTGLGWRGFNSTQEECGVSDRGVWVSARAHTGSFPLTFTSAGVVKTGTRHSSVRGR